MKGAALDLHRSAELEHAGVCASGTRIAMKGAVGDGEIAAIGILHGAAEAIISAGQRQSAQGHIRAGVRLEDAFAQSTGVDRRARPAADEGQLAAAIDVEVAGGVGVLIRAGNRQHVGSGRKQNGVVLRGGVGIANRFTQGNAGAVRGSGVEFVARGGDDEGGGPGRGRTDHEEKGQSDQRGETAGAVAGERRERKARKSVVRMHGRMRESGNNRRISGRSAVAELPGSMKGG